MKSHWLIVNRIIGMFLCVMLASCASNGKYPNPPKVEIVKVPVNVSCVGVLPIKPKLMTDAELTSLKDKPGSFVYALHIDRLQRDAYMAELEAVIEGCK